MISATSIAVIASASTSVPNGSPTRCATTSAWWTAASTEATSAITESTASAVPSGISSVVASSDDGAQRDENGPVGQRSLFCGDGPIEWQTNPEPRQ